MKFKNFFNTILIFSYLSLATFPLVKENINSIFIIICVALTFIYNYINKIRIVFNRRLFFLTLIFWMFLVYNLFAEEFSLKIILLHLPFLIFPILYANKPGFIDKRVFKNSVNVFQVSVIIHLCITLIIYLLQNDWQKIFHISNENIPFFRDFVYHKDFVLIHPTYFSAFLLLSFTISSLKLVTIDIIKRDLFLHTFNVFFCSFFIFLLSSKVIILAYVISLVTIIFSLYKKLNRQQFRAIIIIITIMFLGITYPFKSIIIKRFNEIRTEYSPY